MMVRVSIVMPCYNAEQHLAAGVGSVLAQSYTDWELIIIDDGSQDGTLPWLQAQDDARIRVASQSNQGVSAARNNGLQQCIGDYVAFLDADDTWAPDFLSTMVEALDARPQAVLVYCGWQNIGLPGKRSQPFIPPEYEGPNKANALLEGCRWPIHACLTRLSAIRQVGGFDRELRIGEDYLCWMEVAQLGSILRVPEVLAFYHHHSGVQATQDRARAALDTLLAKQRFLDHHPDVARQLGKARVDAITWGKFIEQANTLYWQGQMESARPLFRKAFRSGHGSLRDKARMLASFLPIELQKALMSTRTDQKQGQQR